MLFDHKFVAMNRCWIFSSSVRDAMNVRCFWVHLVPVWKVKFGVFRWKCAGACCCSSWALEQASGLPLVWPMCRGRPPACNLKAASCGMCRGRPPACTCRCSMCRPAGRPPACTLQHVPGQPPAGLQQLECTGAPTNVAVNGSPRIHK